MIPRVLSLLAAFAAAGAHAQITRYAPPEGETCGCGKAHALMLRAAAGLPIGDGTPAPSYGEREAFGDTDLISNDLAFEVFPSTGVITGSNTMVVESRVSGLTQFTVMLRTQFTASATLNGSTPATISGPPANSYARTITLDRPYNIGERFTVRVDYSGTAVSRGFGSIEFGTTGSGDPIVASLSEAYFAATWFPAKDGDVFQPGDNSDKSTWRISITAPDTLRSVSNGLLLGVDTLAGNKKRYRWQTNYPMSTYLAAFCSTVYNTWTLNYTYPLASGGTGTMPVEFNIYPGSDNPANRAAWGRSLEMLAAYRPVYGEYPFVNEKYGIYQFPFGGGMEHQTNTGQGTFNESVTAHELGHQWWGDNVTCKYWNDIWLNEGFATYTEAIWEERKPGSSGTPALLAAMAARRPGAVNDSVYVYNASIGNMNRIFSSTFTYRKGGWVLHMLRHILGDTTFFQGLRDYRAAFQGSGATTDDFRSVMSDTSGRDLTEFIQQWIYGAGAPEYVYSWQAATINGRPYLRLRVDQTQDNTWGINGAFKMPVDVRIDTASGSTTSVVNNTLRSQYFLVPTAGAATNIVLDEFDWILNTGKTVTAYVAGPPKITSISPAPGSVTTSPATVNSITIEFSDNVAATAGAFSLTGPSGSVPVTYSYNGLLQRATLTAAAPLSPGTYTVTVAQTVTANGAQALDGEMGASLPSGNGAAGGAASWTFSIGNPCPADYNHDGSVDGDDVIDYFADWDAGDLSADFNNDGGVDGDDVIGFFGRWDSGC